MSIRSLRFAIVRRLWLNFGLRVVAPNPLASACIVRIFLRVFPWYSSRGPMCEGVNDHITSIGRFRHLLENARNWSAIIFRVRRSAPLQPLLPSPPPPQTPFPPVCPAFRNFSRWGHNHLGITWIEAPIILFAAPERRGRSSLQHKGNNLLWLQGPNKEQGLRPSSTTSVRRFPPSSGAPSIQLQGGN